MPLPRTLVHQLLESRSYDSSDTDSDRECTPRQQGANTLASLRSGAMHLSTLDTHQRLSQTNTTGTPRNTQHNQTVVGDSSSTASLFCAKQVRSTIAGLLPSEALSLMSGTHNPQEVDKSVKVEDLHKSRPHASPQEGGSTRTRTVLTPPPHISKSALRKAVALFRFILFPDYLWQPERHRHVPHDANIATPAPLTDDGTARVQRPGGSVKSVTGVVPHFFERSLLTDSRVSERHRILRLMVSMLKAQDKVAEASLAEGRKRTAAQRAASSRSAVGTPSAYSKSTTSSTSSGAPPRDETLSHVADAVALDTDERDAAVLAALIRLTEILEVQIYRGFLAVAYEDGIRGGGLYKDQSADKQRPVRKEGNNGGRPKFDLNWLPDLRAPTECARVAADDKVCVCGAADPAALRLRARNIAMYIIERLPKLRIMLHLDVEAVFLHDVAANSIGEVVLCYPGIYYMAHQRLAHELYLLGAPNHVTRLLTEIAHTKTGIDIHPHTSIGHSFFMDHCTGIVVGATSIIGNRVSIYQGVTLGAKAFPLDPVTGEKIKNLPRHPIIEDDVTIYANASVLGRVTIGRGSVIGGNVWIAQSVEPNTTVVQGPANIKMVAAKATKAKEKVGADKAGVVAKGGAPALQQVSQTSVEQRPPGGDAPAAKDKEGSAAYPTRDDVSDVHDAVGNTRHQAAHLLGESFVSSHL